MTLMRLKSAAPQSGVKHLPLSHCPSLYAIYTSLFAHKTEFVFGILMLASSTWLLGLAVKLAEVVMWYKCMWLQSRKKSEKYGRSMKLAIGNKILPVSSALWSFWHFLSIFSLTANSAKCQNISVYSTHLRLFSILTMKRYKWKG